MTRPAEPLLIAGASARAAAFSAVRAGHCVHAADLFADVDLQAVADTAVVDRWPGDVEHWTSTFDQALPLVYVGGLENAPALLDRVAATRPVYGMTGDVLQRIRTPEHLAVLFDAAGISRPALADAAQLHQESDALRRWLVKPRSSAGGLDIRWWNGAPVPPDDGDERRILDEFVVQEFIEGAAGAAAFLAGDDFVELLGVTTMTPTDAALGRPFLYGGSLTVDVQDTGPLERIGRCLSDAGLRGLFGVDFIRRDTPHGTEYLPLEVNPRYTAGMEVLERRDGRSYLDEHVAVWTDARPKPPRQSPVNPSLCYGKQIVYARRSCRAGELPVPTRTQILATPPGVEVADVPRPGSLIPAGAPICTVFATGRDSDECHDRLNALERQVSSMCEPA